MPAPRPDPAPIVLCAGQYGSASTWLFNAIHALMVAHAGEAGVHRQFADRAEGLPARPDRHRLLLVKAHEPGPGLRWLAARGNGRVVLPIRDPRDAAASVIGRFGFDYPLVSGRVERCSAALPLLPLDLPCLVLRYEDGFTQDPRTIGRIARFLGLPAPRGLAARIFEALTPKAVRGQIARLAKAGVFGPNPTSDRHDPATHWHPGHVGDGRPGKFSRVLTPGQVGDILRRTRSFQQAFGYAMPPLDALPLGRRRSLEGWGPGLAYLDAGFAGPDEHGAWTEGPEARLNLPRGRARPVRLLLDVELPGRRRANPMRWSLWAEGGAAPLLGPVAAARMKPREVVEVTVPAEAEAVMFRFEELAPAQEAGIEASRRRLGVRLRGFELRRA